MKKIERSRLVPGFTYWTVVRKDVGFFTSPYPAKVEILRTTKSTVWYRVGSDPGELSVRDLKYRKAEQDLPEEADPLELSLAQATYDRRIREQAIKAVLARTGCHLEALSKDELDELAALLARIHKLEKL